MRERGDAVGLGGATTLARRGSEAQGEGEGLSFPRIMWYSELESQLRSYDDLSAQLRELRGFLLELPRDEFALYRDRFNKLASRYNRLAKSKKAP